ncbi:MAG: chemotaxis protein CheW [Thermodesulfobacteriota bacterium]
MAEEKKGGSLQLSCFYVGKALCGMDINRVQEINKELLFTDVPQSPEYVLGIMNLRGRIVTIIDMGRKLGLGNTEMTSYSRVVIVQSRQEFVGLLVDRIADVNTVQREDVSPPPSNIKGVRGTYFQGVVRIKNGLVAIVDVEKVLEG